MCDVEICLRTKAVLKIHAGPLTLPLLMHIFKCCPAAFYLIVLVLKNEDEVNCCVLEQHWYLNYLWKEIYVKAAGAVLYKNVLFFFICSGTTCTRSSTELCLWWIVLSTEEKFSSTRILPMGKEGTDPRKWNIKVTKLQAAQSSMGRRYIIQYAVLSV